MVLKIPVRLVSQIGICFRNLFIGIIVVPRTRADNTGIYETELGYYIAFTMTHNKSEPGLTQLALLWHRYNKDGT